MIMMHETQRDMKHIDGSHVCHVSACVFDNDCVVILDMICFRKHVIMYVNVRVVVWYHAAMHITAVLLPTFTMMPMNNI